MKRLLGTVALAATTIVLLLALLEGAYRGCLYFDGRPHASVEVRDDG